MSFHEQNPVRCVMNLKQTAELAMRQYGPYRDIDFKEVKYYNAKKVVIDKDLTQMDTRSREEIKRSITYLATNSSWPFKTAKPVRACLNRENSSIHVPTNIYDKSRRILNGVNWTTKLTQQFILNRKVDPTLTWQYFCSSDGFFRVYPAMQWPRDADKVDTFDCRIRKWYIQAATSPKNILILLDSSGSMKGLRFAIARSTVSKILETLSDEDYFNVIQFSDEPHYVDDCFNDTLMPASVDNVRRIQARIDALEAQKFANFEKALKRAFELFRKEQREYLNHYLCNKAIMIITDGAPENFEHIFEPYNWPEKAIRVFTFLIGKEVPENRQTKWMACANKGKFTHISTRADVQENVQKYIQVLSRPLALTKAPHKVWSPVYLDYVTEQGNILVSSGKPADMAPDFEDSYTYQGLGLILTISMPVYDRRETVGPKEEEPNRNLLGVVGTDVRINELMKYIPTYELGVNGYAFAITNHGNILFHPDYSPFYSEGSYGARQQLKVRPKYNSVELSEVELPVPSEDGLTVGHPLRHYLVRLKSGGHNMTTLSVLTHCDGMKRARERKQEYQFMDVSDAFRREQENESRSISSWMSVTLSGLQCNGDYFLPHGGVCVEEGVQCNDDYFLPLGGVCVEEGLQCNGDYFRPHGGVCVEEGLQCIGDYFLPHGGVCVEEGVQCNRDYFLPHGGVCVEEGVQCNREYFLPHGGVCVEEGVQCNDDYFLPHRDVCVEEGVQCNREYFLPHGGVCVEEGVHCNGEYFLPHGGVCVEEGNKEHMQRLASDFNITREYARTWVGDSVNRGIYRKTPHFEGYESCFDNPLADIEKPMTQGMPLKFQIKECFKHAHKRHGIQWIWIGTASGLTRAFLREGNDPFDNWENKNTQTIKSLYYKRAVDGWDSGYKYVFSGTIPNTRKESAANLTITMSTALILGSQKTGFVPTAVAAYNMRYSAFNDHLARHTFGCRDTECHLTCNDTQHVNCYIIDDNGYILANNNPDYNGTGSFLGNENPKLMSALLQDKIFKGLKLVDYQGICYVKAGDSEESSSSMPLN
ncbi:voltage-dependent calcium channel subunit alpha-2/delta-3, partial [Plakobranchus ocellatus]